MLDWNEVMKDVIDGGEENPSEKKDLNKDTTLIKNHIEGLKESNV